MKGMSSNRPTTMLPIKIILVKGCRSAKLAMGPMEPKPGPMSCEVCGTIVSDDVKAFSQKKFKKTLCMAHQAAK